MRDILDALPRADRRQVQRMAEAAGCQADTLALQMVREYLGLVRAAPDALPNTPLRRLTASNSKRQGWGNG